MEKINDLEKMPINNLLREYAVPAIISLFISALYQIIDRIYIGHIPNIGMLGLSGVGLTAPITTIITALSALFAFGASSTISIRLGEGNRNEAEKTVGNAIICIFVTSILLIVGFFVFKSQIFAFFKISGEAAPLASDYIDIIMLGTFFSMLNFAFPIIIRSDGSPRYSMIIALSGCVLNIILNAIFIIGLNMGIQGSALGTVIAQSTSTFLGIFYFWKCNPSLHITRQSFNLDISIIKSIIKIGIVPCLNQLSVSISLLVSNYSLVQYGGESYVGIMIAIRSVYQLFMMVVYGVGQGFQPIVGFNYAKGNYKRVFTTLRFAILWDFCILLIGFVLIQIFPTFWIQLFTKDSSLTLVAVDGLRRFTMLLPLSLFCAVGTSFMMMTNREKSAVFLSISYQLFIITGIIYMLPKILGVNGLWYSQPLADVIATALTVGLFIYNYKDFFKNKGEKI